MTDPAAFTLADNWHGGFYELGMELGVTSDARLGRALAALWQAADVRGCYSGRDREPDAMAQVACTVESLDRFGHLRGLVDLPGSVQVVCGAVAVREDAGADWLDFYLPTGALSRADRRVAAFPFGEDGGPASLEWRRPIDDWLANVARQVYAAVDFRYASCHDAHSVMAALDQSAPRRQGERLGRPRPMPLSDVYSGTRALTAADP